jgi:hypothetical protein
LNAYASIHLASEVAFGMGKIRFTAPLVEVNWQGKPQNSSRQARN